MCPYADNPRDNTDAVAPVTASISRFGFINPVVATMDGEVLAGHTRIKSAALLGEAADLWLTDPPYNVAIGDKYAMINWADGGDRRNTRGIENDDMGDEAFDDFLKAAFTAAADALKPGGSGYVWHADIKGLAFRRAAADAGLDLKQCLVWVKSHFVIGRADYQWRHETCLYVRKPGAPHYFTADRTLDTVLESPAPDLDAMDAAEMRALLRKIFGAKNQTVLRYGKPAKSADHPTEKPVGLFMQLVKNSTRRGETVLDTFAGSGTAVLACEKAGRRARCMELDPQYATVILDRWEAETGQKAERIAEGG